MSTLKYWVWLSSLSELKPKTRFGLLDIFGDPESIYFADDRQLMERCHLTDTERAFLTNKNLNRTNEILESCQQDNITILTLQDIAYPKRLRNIFDPPVVLYIKGRLPTMDEQAAIAIVGTRKATPYGLKMSRKMGFEITKCGGLVVTGLAAGVDSASAEGALRAGHGCVGVLGCAIDVVYPAFNTTLYDDVTAAGALVSEYPPGTPTAPKNFPERNRIISGLSVGVTIIEAPLRSGALITAASALEQGREVFAVPGNADAPNCFGSNALIRDGAALVTCGWDILEDFEQQFPDKIAKPSPAKLDVSHEKEADYEGVQAVRAKADLPKYPPETGRGFAKLRVKNERKKIDKPIKREYIDLKEQLSQLTETQLKIVSVMDETSKHIDDITELAGLNMPTVLSEMTILQIKGFVTQENGKRFTLNIGKR
ncbi:MAG: DNA-processing protein DprA [Oscillospiraceae bacterium]